MNKYWYNIFMSSGLVTRIGLDVNVPNHVYQLKGWFDAVPAPCNGTRPESSFEQLPRSQQAVKIELWMTEVRSRQHGKSN